MSPLSLNTYRTYDCRFLMSLVLDVGLLPVVSWKHLYSYLYKAYRIARWVMGTVDTGRAGWSNELVMVSTPHILLWWLMFQNHSLHYRYVIKNIIACKVDVKTGLLQICFTWVLPMLCYSKRRHHFNQFSQTRVSDGETNTSVCISYTW